MITLLIGDDQYAIKKKLTSFKSALDPAWTTFNYHRFPQSSLSDAIDCALTIPFGTLKTKLIVVEDCNFKQFDDDMLKTLSLLPQIPDFSHLVFVAPSFDKRLKVSKFLILHAMLLEFMLIPPWRTDLIAQSISSQAKSLKLLLDTNTVDYLAQAIGNDLTRAESELQKLAIYGEGRRLTNAEVQALVPSRTQSSLQLAEAIRENNARKAITLLNELLARAEFPLVICATLSTQFRTWLWVKTAICASQQRFAIVSGVKLDGEIAKVCQIANPKRVYFLKKEVAATSELALAQAVTLLLELEVSLKRGAKTDSMLPSILTIARLFQPVQST
ncbi:DNA polymerase III subunit delta [Scytonema hofmannii FACHB-248]|uniref:DNA-directed DNA polymerase n=1 Tax=Scytonema hofmannii FACHB-248 TaxID=1842502 RepID=A0ABR8H0J5_9CYAN|nr:MULTISPECIES: DNA polymerase III subunit delta [Nostocales]MBD2608964.1 DNA polymerase III subunit delta [Scytonema hofmannii FACHB-248]